MTRHPYLGVGALIAGLLVAGPCQAQQAPKVLTDAANDAVTRRTDLGNSGPISPGTGRPDLIRLQIGGWMPSDPAHDAYTGLYVDPQHADIFRLDVTFSGLVNPPGRLLNGEFDPFQFGPTPLYGFMEFDVDQDIDTGGELGGAATQRYLANAARFGGRPQGPAGARAAVWGSDLIGHDFYQVPQFERSGEDFALTLCGCFNVTVVSEDGNHDGVFDPGETWIVRGRFFQRAGGYACADFVFGGSGDGTYDPPVNLRFHHDQRTQCTTVTLVYALTMHGASILATLPNGQVPPDEPPDANVGNRTSVYEGLFNLVNSNRQLLGPCWDLAHRWREGRNAADYLDPTRWDVTAIFGTSYSEAQPGAYYVWTDLGFDFFVGDFDGDRRASSADRSTVQTVINTFDGGPWDCDGDTNASVQLCDFSQNFSMYDVDGDGYITASDLGYYATVCLVNWDGQAGVDSADFFAFINDFLHGNADFDHNGVTDSFDFFAFLSAFFAGGC